MGPGALGGAARLAGAFGRAVGVQPSWVSPEREEAASRAADLLVRACTTRVHGEGVVGAPRLD